MSTKPFSPTIRTTAGLREVLFQEIDLLRAGKSNPGRACAVAKLAVQIINVSMLEIHVGRADRALLDRTKPIQFPPLELGR